MSAAGALHFGNLGRNAIAGPGFGNTDVSIIKNLRLAGAARLQFRLEVFNIFNQANLGLPGRVATIGSTAVHVLYPSDTPPSAGWPGVAFAHGFQLQPSNYDVILTDLGASATPTPAPLASVRLAVTTRSTIAGTPLTAAGTMALTSAGNLDYTVRVTGKPGRAADQQI